MSVRDNRQAEAVGLVAIVMLVLALAVAAVGLLTWSATPEVANEPGAGSSNATETAAETAA